MIENVSNKKLLFFIVVYMYVYLKKSWRRKYTKIYNALSYKLIHLEIKYFLSINMQFFINTHVRIWKRFYIFIGDFSFYNQSLFVAHTDLLNIRVVLINK